MNEHINYIEMPLIKLQERCIMLSNSLNRIEHCPERKNQIQVELGNIAFELYSREQELKNK